MDIESRYQQIIEKLQQGHRFMAPIPSNEIDYLVEKLKTASGEELAKVLCVIENTSTQAKEFAGPLLELLSREQLQPQNIIFALNAVRRHIILRQQKLGQRLEMPTLQVLQNLLQHRSPEVVEWTLRTIDEIGSQGIFFKEQWRKIRPGFLARKLDRHKQAIFDIISMFEQRWKL